MKKNLKKYDKEKERNEMKMKNLEDGEGKRKKY